MTEGMTLSQAIEILGDYVYEDKPCDVELYDEATRLGIEALKRIKLQRSPRGFGYSYRLPGEEADDA